MIKRSIAIGAILGRPAEPDGPGTLLGDARSRSGGFGAPSSPLGPPRRRLPPPARTPPHTECSHVEPAVDARCMPCVMFGTHESPGRQQSCSERSMRAQLEDTGHLGASADALQHIVAACRGALCCLPGACACALPCGWRPGRASAPWNQCSAPAQVPTPPCGQRLCRFGKLDIEYRIDGPCTSWKIVVTV